MTSPDDRNAQPVIAIDGPVGAGKSTVAREVARRLGCTLLDTGAIYRAVALLARRRGIDWDDERALAALAGQTRVAFRLTEEGNRIFVAGEDLSAGIRAPEISDGASRVSRLAAVRDALLDLQRGFARQGLTVAEGRDMATRVFPRAAVKVYLDGSPEERARRRHRELLSMGRAATYDEVLEAARRRDAADSQRAIAPLRLADDAVRIDTTGLGIDEVVDRVVELWREASAQEA